MVLPAVPATVVAAPGASAGVVPPPPVEPPPPLVGVCVVAGVCVCAVAGVVVGLVVGVGVWSGSCAGIRGPAPDAFDATTKNLYFTSGSSPTKRAIPAAPPLIVTDLPPGTAINVMDVIGELPTSAGGENETEVTSPLLARTPVT